MPGLVDLSGRRAALGLAAPLMVSISAAVGVIGALACRQAFHWSAVWLFVDGWYPAARAFGRATTGQPVRRRRFCQTSVLATG